MWTVRIPRVDSLVNIAVKMRLRTRTKSQGDTDHTPNDCTTQNMRDSSSDSESDDDMKELAARTCQAVKETLGLPAKSNPSTLNLTENKGHGDKKDFFIIDKTPSICSSKDVVTADESDDETEEQVTAVTVVNSSAKKSKKKKRRKKKSVGESAVKDPYV